MPLLAHGLYRVERGLKMKKPYAVFYIQWEPKRALASIEDCIDDILESVQVKYFKRYGDALNFFNDLKESCAFRIMDRRKFNSDRENTYIDTRTFCQLEILKPLLRIKKKEK